MPGAVLVPLGEVPARARELPLGSRVYVVRATGNRSLTAARELAAQGVDARSVDGGTVAWQAAGLPIVRGARSGVA